MGRRAYIGASITKVDREYLFVGNKDVAIMTELEFLQENTLDALITNCSEDASDFNSYREARREV